MNHNFYKHESFETRTSCPLCHDDLAINWQKDNIPYFGEIMYISAKCQCSFRFADTLSLSSKEPIRYEISVETQEDLDVRIIRSTSGTIHIPEMGITIEPGMASESYITNIEGVLHRIRSVLMTASRWVQEEEDKFSRSQELLCMLEEVIACKKKITVIIEDPFGNSAIISKKATTTKLSKEEAEKLNSGMIVLDIEKSEFTHKALEKIQFLEGN